MPVSAFAEDWESRPRAPVCVGLRLMSDGDKSKARAEAEHLASELHSDGGELAIEAYNDALMRQIVALAICSPNDATIPSELFPSAEEQVRVAITSEGAKLVFQEYLKYEVESSPIHPEATNDELVELAVLIDTGVIQRLDKSRESIARTFLRYALDEIRSSMSAAERN